jgi:predicted DNA-binding protein
MIKILALIELVPLIEKIIDFLVLEIAKDRIEKGDEKFISAMQKAHLKGSVIDLRDELGRVAPRMPDKTGKS